MYSPVAVCCHIYLYRKCIKKAGGFTFTSVSNTKYGEGGKKSEDYMRIILVIEHSPAI